MHVFLRRLVCGLLCLGLLLPSAALAQQDATGLRFSLSFQMEPESFPPENRHFLQGLADLVNILTLQGTMEQSFTGCFDLKSQLLLAQQEETSTTLRVFGTEAAWGITSSLLGQEMLLVDLSQLLEFAMKTYSRLNIPVQQVALLLSPYLHTNALALLEGAWKPIMQAEEGNRTIPAGQLQQLAVEMADISMQDSSFQTWVQAIAMDAGYDEAILEIMASLPQWLETWMTPEGIAVSRTGATETWQSGDVTLFTRTVEEALTAWSLTLPMTPNGYRVNVFSRSQQGGEQWLQIDIKDEMEATVLGGTIQASGLQPQHMTFPCRLEVKLSGEALGEEVHLLLEGQEQDDFITLRMLNAATGQPQLTISGNIEAYTPEAVPEFTASQLQEGFSILSINEGTLSRLMDSIAAPMLQGLLPLLTHTPSTSVQSLLDWLEEHQMIQLLLSSSPADIYAD